MSDHISKLADGVFSSVKGYIARSMEPLLARMTMLEQCRPEKGDKGDPGEAGISVRGDKGADGETGAAGKDGADGKDADAAAITAEVLERVATALPVPKDGRDGKDADPATITAEVLARVTEVLDAIPVPKDGADGKDADPALILMAVERAVAAIQKPVDGKDGTAGMDGKDGLDGKDADPAVIHAEVERAIAALPKPEDGEPGTEGRDGREGEPGRDALQIEVLDGIDPHKRYQRGTFAHFHGGIIRAFRATDPMSDDGIEKAGWHVVVEGIAELVVDLADDDRTFTVKHRRTSGTEVVKSFVLPTQTYRGIWLDKEYQRADTTTHGGSLWHCKRPTKDKPGTSDAWQLCAKAGRDGKDGKDGEKGDRGAEGRKGTDLTQLGGNGAKW